MSSRRFARHAIAVASPMAAFASLPFPLAVDCGPRQPAAFALRSAIQEVTWS
jgi:hypothetical protein